MVLQMKQKEPPLPIENLPFPFGPLLDECWAVDVDKRPSMTGMYRMVIAYRYLTTDSLHIIAIR